MSHHNVKHKLVYGYEALCNPYEFRVIDTRQLCRCTAVEFAATFAFAGTRKKLPVLWKRLQPSLLNVYLRECDTQGICLSSLFASFFYFLIVFLAVKPLLPPPHRWTSFL